MMKRTKKWPALLITLALSVPGIVAAADHDDNYPWQSEFPKPVSFINTTNSASCWQGPSPGLMDGIESAADVDFHVMSCERYGSGGTIKNVSISFTHASGDLDIELYTVDGIFIGSSTGVGDGELITALAAGRSSVVMRVYGYRGAVNRYNYCINCN